MATRADLCKPWYQPLSARVSLRGFLHTRAGSLLTHQLVRLLEAVRLAPRGTLDVHDLLRLSQRALVAGGETGIFTPMYFFLARKG
jgi:sterol 24-C-methyltransferase